MAEAKRDENHIPTILAISNADGETTLPVWGDSGLHALAVSDGLGGSDLSGDVDARDQNRVVAFMAVSSVDGVTPVPVYATLVGNRLLIRST